jgi:phytol kinase
METVDWITLAVVYAIIIGSVIAGILVKRHCPKVDPRKVIHVGVGLFVFVWWAFTTPWVMLIFFTVPFAIGLLVIMIKDDSAKTEIGSITKMGNKTGLFFYAISITVLVALFFDHWTAASIGVVAMTFGDAAGSIFGKRFGKHHYVSGKSIEGSIAVFAVTAVMTAVIIFYYSFLTANGWFPRGDSIGTVPWWTLSLLAGMTTSLLEAACPGEIDNLVIPLSVALMMTVLGL